MNLREWCSNSTEFVAEEDRLYGEKTKLLGLIWDKKSDVLNIKETKVEVEGVLTKRKMLCNIASHFDPLGLISPIIQRAKSMIQKLWKLNLDWDVPVPKDVESEWKELEKDLKNISEISVSRFIGIKNSLGNEAVVTELHCFCDSSATAYAACVYMRVEQNREITTNLSFTKTRLAPIKTLTIPRLELMPALIGVRILKFVEKELKIKIVKKYIWCDSKCVLYWIANKRLKSAFVENRLKEIRLCENTEFRYVSTTENPADLPTRGMSTLELKTSNLWWNGPEWLHQGKDQWPDKLVSSADEIKFEEIENRKTATLTMVTVADNCTFGSIIKKYSTLTKSLRVIAYILRAKKIFEKIDTRKGTLSVEELNEAQKLLDKLLPTGRRIIESIIKKCWACKKWEGGPFQPPVPPALPKERLLEAPAFTYVGVDYLGPLIIKDGDNEQKKVCICLFTCAVIRAVHLELVPDMTTNGFIEAFR
ncbi:unnamed protein product [Didymodactylos carnosus]|uniref:Uncharacterized protein n=1 Tax=Didymodactylos carnosus TaxID=1234261 RepID=A0A815YPS6_9BILA|nr:unnamed protein product [Didymodactylos carnosus]CAF4438196.1 unnamed protein product [Didymodactylos carnosus]